MVVCKCGESKRVTISVAHNRSERQPLPIWRYHCKTCDSSWTEDENEPRTESA